MITVGAFILTMVLRSDANGDITSFTQIHSSSQTCETAKESIRVKLTSAKVIMASCNPQ